MSGSSICNTKSVARCLKWFRYSNEIMNKILLYLKKLECSTPDTIVDVITQQILFAVTYNQQQLKAANPTNSKSFVCL